MIYPTARRQIFREGFFPIVGMTLAQYQITNEISEGGIGEVYMKIDQ